MPSIMKVLSEFSSVLTLYWNVKAISAAQNDMWETMSAPTVSTNHIVVWTPAMGADLHRVQSDSTARRKNITSMTALQSKLWSSSNPVWMGELDHKEGWAPKNWCLQTVVLERTLGSPLDCKELQPVHPKGNLPWIFIGRTGAEAETPILWPDDAKSWLVRKDSDAGKYWGQEEKEMTEDEAVG